MLMKHQILSFAAVAACMLASAASPALADVYPTTLISYTPGTQKGGSAIVVGRDNPNNALGMPDNSDATTDPLSSNFVSLGFGGSITMRFSLPVTRGAGADFNIYETSFGDPSCASHPETAHVYFSQNGVSWFDAGTVCMNGDLELPMSLGYARFVRIDDVSNTASFSDEQDGYDVDGITGHYTYTPPPTLPCDYSVMAVSNYVKGKTKGNGNLPVARTNANNALVPQMMDAAGPINFTSLGFDNTPTDGIDQGQITLELAASLVNVNGTTADLAVYETSWGDNPGRSDADYPEMAAIYGSNDGVSFYLLTAVGEDVSNPAGVITRDGLVDISNMPMTDGQVSLRFVKIIDKSMKSSPRFPSSADGYDVDGILPLNCLPTTPGNRGDIFPEYVSEIASDVRVAVSPNPARMGTTVSIFLDAQQAGHRTIDLYDVTGKKVQAIYDGNVTMGSQTLDWNVRNDRTLRTGVYFLRISGIDNEAPQSVRVLIAD